MSIRPIKRIVKAKPTVEGAGVRLRRGFGFGNTADFDPFLLFDDFRNDVPDDYPAGFPWHPHRGIETITYVLAGSVEPGDSLGNRGVIGAGDVQWMTAGRGIVHQEMPKGDPAGRMHGFQLWANLPAALKMTTPRYQEVKAADIPEVLEDDGTRVRVVCGRFRETTGPVEGVAADPIYLDVSVPPGRRKHLPVEGPGAPSPMCSRDRDASATHRLPSRCRRKGPAGRTRPFPKARTTARSSSSAQGTRSRCRPEPRGSASSWPRGSPSGSPSHGTVRS